MFVMLLLLTKADKRTSPIFIINTLSLVFNLIRNILLCLYFTSAFNESYAYFAGDYSRVPQSDYANSITATAFQMLTLISIEASLCLQVRVVCTTLRRVYRTTILVVSLAIALMAIGLRMVYTVKNDIMILQTTPQESLEGTRKRHQHCNISQYLLVFGSLRCQAWLRVADEEETGSWTIWFHANHLHYGLPDFDHTRHAVPFIECSQPSTNNVSQPCSQSYNILLPIRQCHPKSSRQSSSSSLSHHSGPPRPSKAAPNSSRRKVLSAISSAAMPRVLHGRQLSRTRLEAHP